MTTLTMPVDYHNRHDPAKNYERLLFVGKVGVQAPEFNELQSGIYDHVKNIADTLFKDGDVAKDGRVVVNPDTGQATCEAGLVYLNGKVRHVPAKSLQLPLQGVVAVGVYLQSSVVTALEDPSLLDPTRTTRNYNQPGAARLKVQAVWGYANDGQTGDFYPVYTVDNGILLAKDPPPNLDSVTQAIARYDRDSAGGDYVVSGLQVAIAPDSPSGEQMYTVTAGRAHVNGHAMELGTSRRIVYAAVPDSRTITGEPQLSSGPAAQRVNLAFGPVAVIEEVRITKESVPITLTHGSYAGAMDLLPETSVLDILEVKQGATTYVKGTDYKLTAGKTDWSLPGAEPAPGSTYTVVFRYIEAVTPTAVDESGFTVEGAVAGTLIETTYQQKLPRYDCLVTSDAGELTWVKGVAADYNPQVPAVPPGLLLLATVHQTWTIARQVINSGNRMMPMAELSLLRSDIDAVMAQLAELRLVSNAQTREAGAKKGLLVDPFVNDSVRDAGTAQTAVTVGGMLTLPITATAHALPSDVAGRTALASTLVSILEQPLRTGSMKVNPYLAFDPIPAAAALTPAVDQWTDVISTYADPVTERFTVGAGNRSSVSTSTSDVLLSSSLSRKEYLRQIDVQFRLSGFGGNETLATVRFDGLAVTPANVANNNGVVTGKITIPAHVPAGSKRVEFVGGGGSRGEAVFVGAGTLQTDQRQLVTRVTTTVWWQADPLAQTFSLPRAAHIGGVDLWFTAKGTSTVVVQIRETSTGLPTRTVLAEARLAPANINLAGTTRAVFDTPVWLPANTEYAIVVLSNDADTALSIAELGQWDDYNKRWITSQPFQVGVLLSSSNASTWTAHQDKDMAFRLLAAQCSETTRLINLGSVAVTAATDLMLLSLSHSPVPDAYVSYSLGLPDNVTLNVADGQPVRLANPITGNVTVTATLHGTAGATPVLFPGSQLIVGQVAASADYVSRAIPAGSNARVRVILEGDIPSGANVAVSVSGVDAGDTWHPAGYLSSTPLGDNWHELTFELASVSEAMVKVKLDLGGNSAARPQLKDLRVIVQ